MNGEFLVSTSGFPGVKTAIHMDDAFDAGFLHDRHRATASITRLAMHEIGFGGIELRYPFAKTPGQIVDVLRALDVTRFEFTASAHIENNNLRMLDNQRGRFGGRDMANAIGFQDANIRFSIGFGGKGGKCKKLSRTCRCEQQYVTAVDRHFLGHASLLEFAKG